MKNNLGLNLIYRELSENRLKVLYFFSDAGFVNPKTLEELGPVGMEFDSIEAMTNFSLKVCTELQAPEVFVLSVTDYNSGVEGTRDVRNFREIYRRFGHALVNPEFKREKTGLFSKFFKE